MGWFRVWWFCVGVVGGKTFFKAATRNVSQLFCFSQSVFHGEWALTSFAVMFFMCVLTVMTCIGMTVESNSGMQELRKRSILSIKTNLPCGVLQRSGGGDWQLTATANHNSGQGQKGKSRVGETSCGDDVEKITENNVNPSTRRQAGAYSFRRFLTDLWRRSLLLLRSLWLSG